jgi:hypothetical protein
MRGPASGRGRRARGHSVSPTGWPRRGPPSDVSGMSATIPLLPPAGPCTRPLGLPGRPGQELLTPWPDAELAEFGAALVWFDAALDAPTLQFIHEDRCAASIAAPFVDEAGNVYVIGDGALGFDVIASPKKSALPQCVRRVLAGETQFDSSFFVDLQAATGSPGFRDSHAMGMGKILLNLWAPSLRVADYAMASPDWYWKLNPTFEYVIVDSHSKVATPVSGLPRAAAQFSTTLRVDGRNYVQSYRSDNGAVISHVATDGSVAEVLELGAGTDIQYVGRL